jgi:hypothetical protein
LVKLIWWQNLGCKAEKHTLDTGSSNDKDEP